MNRRGRLAIASAAALPRPSPARADGSGTARLAAQPDFALPDPVQSTPGVTMPHACLVFDTLWGADDGQVQDPPSP